MARSVRHLAGLIAACLLVFSSAPLAAVPWLPFGPDGGDARRFAADPSDHLHLFLGTANGWIYQSHTAGASWTRLARISQRDDLVLDSIVVDVKNSRHIIVGAYAIDRADGGVFISNDGGQNWINQAEMRGQSIRTLAASASDPKVMVAGTLQGVFRTVDGGLRWKLISPHDSVEIHNVKSIAIDPKDPNIIYAGTWHLPWKTTDGGEHWDNIKEGIIDDSDVFSIIVDPVDPRIVYASACSGIYKSKDAGERFEKVNGIPTTARRTRVLLQDPNHLETVFAGTTEGLWRSDDAGRSWTRTTGPETIVNDVAIDEKDSRHVLIATDRGGVLSSDDGGDTFHSANGGFSARQITTLKRDAVHPATLFVGVVNDKEWGGVFESDNGGLAWKQRSEGLQGRDVLSLGQAVNGTMIAGTAHGLFLLDVDAKKWNRVDATPGDTPPDSGSPSVGQVAIRAPVPIGRNEFAQRNLHVVQSPRRASSSRQRGLTPAARDQAAASGRTRLKQTGSKHNRSSRKVGVAKVGQVKAHGPAARKAQVLAQARGGVKNRSGKGRSNVRTATVSRSARTPASAPTTVSILAPASPSLPSRGFDGPVSGIVNSGKILLASTSMGLLTSSDNGITWLDAGIDGSADWRYLAAAGSYVVSASLRQAQVSSDSGATWKPLRLPGIITQISAVAVDLTGELWAGSREGVFVSADGGDTWSTPKNLYVSSVANLFFEEQANRMLVTTGGNDSIVFTVQLPQKQITYSYSGWSLRLARPVGDHVVAATLFDGIVVEPKLVDTPIAPAPAAKQTGDR